MKHSKYWIGVALSLATQPVMAQSDHSEQSPTSSAIEVDGTVNVPAFRLPPSDYLSDEARAALPRTVLDYGNGLEGLVASGMVPQIRATITPEDGAALTDLQERYNVVVQPVTIAGVGGIWVRPISPVPGPRRILINLSGGGFLFANHAKGGIEESAPLAGRGDFDVLTIDYAQAPEAQFPAASIDVANVYRVLLESYPASDIGLFGNSSGGQLVAQAMVWFQQEGLPTPAAAGMFCATADARWGGDSWFWHKPISGAGTPPFLVEQFYYADHDLDDPLISPIRSDEMLSQFPPTLLLTSTRGGDLSATVDAHRRLVRNGVDAELMVWDGLGHCFHTDDSLPESQEALDAMVRFFVRHVGSENPE